MAGVALVLSREWRMCGSPLAFATMILEMPETFLRWEKLRIVCNCLPINKKALCLDKISSLAA